MARSIAEILLETLENLEGNNLEQFQWYLTNGDNDFIKIPKAHLENSDITKTVDKMMQFHRQSGAVEVTLKILKKMNQNQLAEELSTNLKEKEVNDPNPNPAMENKDNASTADVEELQAQLMSILGSIYDRISNGNTTKSHREFVDDVYTDLIIVPDESGGVIQAHEIHQLQKFSNQPVGIESCVNCSDLFRVQCGTNRRNRKVLTMGIAGVGKTVSVTKFISDWANKEMNKDIDFIFPLPFHELNPKKDKKFSLIELLNYFFFNSKPQLTSLPKDDGKILFIFDGLDECRFPLCFEDGEELNDVNEQVSLGSLITNLLKRKLLPFALIWITCRPAAAQLIPRDLIDLVTEVRGFNDKQKEIYFSKFCNKDEEMKEKMVSHIKRSRSLYIMCQIPVFCWISACVLKPLLAQNSSDEVPATLTGMYTIFLLQQKHLMMKYPTKRTTDTEYILLKLGKLAFHTLESGKLTFYEDDLRKCGINIPDGTVFSGVCTQIFRQEEIVSEKNIFSFVHLSVQECLAALYVHFKYCNDRRNAFEPFTICNMLKWKNKNIADLHKCAVERALQSKNGHLDLFLRFLLGLSLESNQKTLQELLPKLKINVEGVKDTSNYIKEKLNEQTSIDRNINLLHCLSELRDHSLTSEIQNFLTTGCLSSQKLSSTQWSVLVFVLLMSEETEEEFDLKKYMPSDEALRRLLPVMKSTQRALLDHCNLSKDSCKALASAFSSESPLRELDLSYNDLQDRGIDLLSVQLSNISCKLEVLRLAHCNFTTVSCEALASALQSEKCPLKELDLSNNDLKDLGVKLLSDGLKHSRCKLEILRLSGCLVTEEGCSSLASALKSNPSHLKELDLTYNHPGHSGERQLLSLKNDPQCKLKTLRLEHAGKIRINHGLRKYACDITFAPNTAHKQLSLSDGNKTVKYTQEPQSYLDLPVRFDYWEQVLCSQSLTGRCYWECEWSGIRAGITMAYEGIGRKGQSYDSHFGWNKNSWTLDCTINNYCALHNKNGTEISVPQSHSKRIGVYLDCLAGTLTFYSVSSETHKLTNIHTFYSTFTEPLFVGFRVGAESSVRLCQIE